MTTLTLEKPLDNELEKQTIEDMNQGSQEPASKADLRNLTVRLESKFAHIDSRFVKIDARFDRVDAQFAALRIDLKEELFEFREAMRKEMFRFAGFLTFTGLTALGIFATVAR